MVVTYADYHEVIWVFIFGVCVKGLPRAVQWLVFGLEGQLAGQVSGMLKTLMLRFLGHNKCDKFQTLRDGTAE